MIITAWNCNMAFDKKAAALDPLHSDILVISECANEAKLAARGLRFPEGGFQWVGEKINKGLAVIARPPYSIVPLFEVGDFLPIWAAPYRITTPAGRCVDLIAVWSYWLRDKRNVTGNPVVEALRLFGSRLDLANLMVAGDFNNNVFWDRKNKPSNHSETSKTLAQIGLLSAYHWQGSYEYGNEPHPTIYWQGRKVDGPRFHIDYIYAPNTWLVPEVTVDVGDFGTWVGSKLSDHVPITTSFPALF
jgi:exodeoxyribonuclease-3